MSTKQRMLLDTARAYIMLAQELQVNDIKYRHYLYAAKWCINMYHTIENNDATIKLVA